LNFALGVWGFAVFATSGCKDHFPIISRGYNALENREKLPYQNQKKMV